MQYLAVRLFYQNQLLQHAWRVAWQLHPGIADRGSISAPICRNIWCANICFPAHGPIRPPAFERTCRDEICNAIALNRRNGRWMTRARWPKSQVVFCIDEREESIHRITRNLIPIMRPLAPPGSLASR